jgi:hypothetical protein
MAGWTPSPIFGLPMEDRMITRKQLIVAGAALVAAPRAVAPVAAADDAPRPGIGRDRQAMRDHR